jgi:hypothetical protein
MFRDMKNKSRKVKSGKRANLKSSVSSGYSRAQKAKIRSKQRAQKLALTQAKKYLIYAVVCFILVQIVKFVMYGILFTGDNSPTGFGFLLVAYLQTGLLLLTFVFFVLAIFKTLQRLLTEEF